MCERCVLPESKPDIWLNEEGICNICLQHDQMSNLGEDPKPLETDFIKILKKNKGKGEYDCLVMCSGGKDSTSALYFMKERYKVNPLAFTFDHGFETEEAMENVRRAVNILGVDFLYFKSDYMKDMFARILKTGSKAVICHPCSIWYMQLAFDITARFQIPIIIAGWTKGQSTRQDVMSKCGCNVHAPEFRAMSLATIDFLNNELKNMPKYKNFPRSMEEVLKRARKRHKSMVISPHWFLPMTADEYAAIIQKELNWRFPKESYPARTTNCKLNFLSVYLTMKHFGYTHYHVEMSKLIRNGQLSREEALKDLEINFDKEMIDKIYEELGCEPM